MGHFTAAEPQRDLYLVAIVQKFEHVTHFDVIVIGIGVRSELDLFDLDDLLLFAGFRFALLGLVFEFAEIHDLAHGRIGIGRDLDQVQAGFFGHFHSATGCHDPDVFAVGTNQADFIRADIFVNARACVSLWRRVMGSASDDERPLIVPISRSQKVNPPPPFFKPQNELLLRKMANYACNYAFQGPFDAISMLLACAWKILLS